MNNLPVLSLHGDFYTDYSGIRRLFEFYHSACEHSNTTIYLDFYRLNWIDANLCALLQSMLVKLNEENNLSFSADLNFIKQKFHVLFRNGFISSQEPINNELDSVIILKSFNSKDKNGFIDYVKNELLSHASMPDFEIKTHERIMDSLIELYNNIDSHSKSTYPFFVCGQYFPAQKKIVFSMVDLGVGFLPQINIKTKGKISTSFESIIWALEKRHTTRLGTPGGLGLTELYDYCEKNNGVLQIITGDTYWSSDLKNTIFTNRTFEKSYVGSIVNLHFNCN